MGRLKVLATQTSKTIVSESGERITRKLKRIIPIINGIQEKFHTPAISCGVSHGGKTIFQHFNGYADIENQLKPDENTIYPIASCTKGIVAIGLGILHSEGKIDWDEPVANYLPDFRNFEDSNSEQVIQKATLRDLCSHRTGLASLDHVCIGFHDEVLQDDGEHLVEIAAHLPSAWGFRENWLYNNWMFAVAAKVIERVSGMSFGQFLKERIFDQIGMHRTFVNSKQYENDLNKARAYHILDNNTPLHQNAFLEDSGLYGGAGCVRSTVKDILKWANEVMKAEASGSLKGRSSVSGKAADYQGPLNPSSVSFVRGSHSIIPPPVNTTYGLGWFKYSLPNQSLGAISSNAAFLGDDEPLLGAGKQFRDTIGHNGDFGGFQIAFYTFPHTQSAIIVFANSSSSRGDPSDLIAQALMQALFDTAPKLDYVQYACQVMEASSQLWPKLVEDFEQHRVKGTRHGPISDYVGSYVNSGFKMTLTITALVSKPMAFSENSQTDLLLMKINNRESQIAKLRHYHYDIFTFLPRSRDDAIRMGFENYLALPLVLLAFQRNGVNGKIVGVYWDLEGKYDLKVKRGPESVLPVWFEKLVGEQADSNMIEPFGGEKT